MQNPKISKNKAKLMLTADKPWPGLSSFEVGSERFFYGREKEAQELSRRINSNRLTLIYGESGRGKTSLIQAGLFPELKRKNTREWLIIHIKRIDFNSLEEWTANEHTLIRQIGNSIYKQISEIAPNIGAKILARLDKGDELWSILCDEDISLSQCPEIPRLLIIIDQFEEIFTKGAQHPDAVKRFVTELAGIVENRPTAALERKIEYDADFKRHFDSDLLTAHVAIVIREDYLGKLEQYRHMMPSMMRNRFALNPFYGTQAYQAVYKPGLLADPQNPIISEQVADKIVRLAARDSDNNMLNNLIVKPSMVALFCRELNQVRDSKKITSKLVDSHADQIMTQHYERAFEGIPLVVRHIIEDRLVSKDGTFREGVHLKTLSSELKLQGIESPEIILRKLEQTSRVISIEERGGRDFVELTHDQLLEPAATSKLQRHQKELSAKREQQMRKYILLSIVGIVLLSIATLAGWLMAAAQKEHLEEEIVANENLTSEKLEFQKNNKDRKKYAKAPSLLKEIAYDPAANRALEGDKSLQPRTFDYLIKDKTIIDRSDHYIFDNLNN